ncbi:hypothetical protein Aperf_G00000099692 [Anoplocephala perfoliata]
MLLYGLIVFLLSSTSAQWFPPILTESGGKKPFFRPVNYPDLHDEFLSQFTKQLRDSPNYVNGLDVSNFRWTSVTMFRESNTPKSWLIAAGTSLKQNRTGTAFSTSFGAVFGCRIDALPSEPGGFNIFSCEILGLDTGTPNLNHTDAGLLGKGLQSLQLPTGGVVVFCDPLSHSNQGLWLPSGKCNVLQRTSDKWWSVGPIEFCSAYGSTQPCAGGFSVDLRPSDDGTNAQLLSGLPFALPTRRVRTVDDILGTGEQRIRDIVSEENFFGSSVAWSPFSPGRRGALAIVGSPSTSVRGFEVTRLGEDVDNQVLGISGSDFGGLGFVVETSIVGAGLAVFAGAPFEEVDKVGSNAGRVYVQFKDNEKTQNFSLNGTRPGEMFGYAIARIGDVDGDGIGELAISAPAIGAEKTLGRVYIHRVLSDYRLEQEPLQILEAPNNAPGFGVSVSRSIDIDSDGGPELTVTTLDPKIPLILYSLPPRLRAICTSRSQPRVTANQIRKGDIITVRFTVNFIDSVTGKPFPAPSNFESRSCQMNPDILWLERYDYISKHPNESDFLSEILSIKESFKIDPAKPRFSVEEVSVVRVSSSGSVTVNTKLQAQEDAQYMELDTIPLHVAFRSVLADPQCDGYTRNCPKSVQPLIDWSDCVWKLPPPSYLCPPHPKCSANLQISINGGGDSHTPVQFGRREDVNQTLMFVLRNNGPTRSEGVRVLIKALGWPKNGTQPGIRVLINNVQVRDVATGILVASSDRPSTQWSISLPSDRAAALITAQQDTAINPDQELFIIINTFLSGLASTRYNETGELEEEMSKVPSPGLLANVSAVIEDPSMETNIATSTFDITYKPQVRINPGAAPPALVDERKEPPHLTGSTKIVLGNDVGPRLEHIYLVENVGATDLNDLAFELEIPVRTSEGDTLLYLTDKARLLDGGNADYRWVNTLPKVISADGNEVGSCEIAEEFVNPLNLTIREVGYSKSLRTDQPVIRRRRALKEDSELKPSRVTFTSPFGDNRVDVYFKRAGQLQTTISCDTSIHPANQLDFSIVCVRVVCRVSRLSRADVVRVSLTGWLWTPTFFKHQLPDVKFVTRLSVFDWGEPPRILLAYPEALLDFPDIPPAYELQQAVVFRGVAGKYRARIPIWPIIVGAVCGSILLFGLIASLYCCGFFRRRQKTNAAKRKSMMAAAAARGRQPVHAIEDHPATFLLDKGKNGNGSSGNGRNAEIYTANPMHAGSPDLLYATSPQPPTPLPEEPGEWDEHHPLEEAEEKVERLEPEEVPLEKSQSRDPSPSSSAGLPDWLMSEIKKNEDKGKKSKSSKSDS